MAKVVHIVNPTGSEVSNVNAGGVDIPAYSLVTDVTLTDAEAGTLIDAQKVLLIKATCSQEERRLASKILRLGKNPGSATS
jgi:hypothetical protein